MDYISMDIIVTPFRRWLAITPIVYSVHIPMGTTYSTDYSMIDVTAYIGEEDIPAYLKELKEKGKTVVRIKERRATNSEIHFLDSVFGYY